MRSFRRFSTLIGCICAIACLPVHATLAADANQTHSSEWRAAAAAIVITPEQPMWMAGYAARNKSSEGKVHDLFAKVLVLQDRNDHRLALVTVDLIAVSSSLRSAVEQGVLERFKLPAEDLVMNASHTHCGPDLRADVSDRYGVDPKYSGQAQAYADQLAARIVDMIGQALEKLQPVTLKYSHARCGFAMNRRLPTERGFANSPNPDGPVDHDVPVLQVVTAVGKLHAVVFGYACHNTTLSFYQFCGDYAGFAHQNLEAAHPGTIALFVMGCGADQNPYPRRTLDLAKQHGRTLANAVEAALETRRTRPIHGPLRTALNRVTLEFAPPPSRKELERQVQSKNKYERGHAQRLLKQLDQNGTIRTEYQFPLQAIQFGNDLTFIAMCGETVVDYALRLKGELRNPKLSSTVDGPPVVWVAGYCNDVFGYLPSLRVLQEGGYEGGGAMRYTSFPGPFAPSVEERVLRQVRDLVAKVRVTP